MKRRRSTSCRVLAAALAGLAAAAPARGETKAGGASVIPLEWLTETVSVDRAEADHPGITDERIGRFPAAGRPFGFANAAWEALKGEMRPGDALWAFSSPDDSWRNLAGRAGVALVRDGRVIDVIVTTMN